MARPGRTYDPNTNRWYKAGYSPEELTRSPIAATCGCCGGPLLIYPDGAYCAHCSPPWMAAMLANDNDRRRVAAGYMPATELLED